MRYLGIDWGEKRIGLAIGDSEVNVVTPIEVASDIDGVLRVVDEEDIDTIIIGKPLTMGNKEDFMKKRVDEFLSELKKKIDIKIVMHDERLSSKGADSLPGDKKSKAPRDSVAAMLILESYLERHKNKVL